MKSLILFAVIVTSIVFTFDGASAEADYGDQASATLTTKSWDALGSGQYDDALKYTGKCRALYQEQAEKMQQGLSDFPAVGTEGDFWALNDVGTCLFIEGQVLEKKGKLQAALAAYKELVDKLGYSQCYDPKGWFWKPAEAAGGRIEELAFEAEMAGDDPGEDASGAEKAKAEENSE